MHGSFPTEKLRFPGESAPISHSYFEAACASVFPHDKTRIVRRCLTFKTGTRKIFIASTRLCRSPRNQAATVIQCFTRTIYILHWRLMELDTNKVLAVLTAMTDGGVVETKGAILSINEGIQEINGRRHGQVAGTTANFNFKLS